MRAAATLHAAEEIERLEAAAALADAETEESELRVLVAARDHLDMEVAYCSRFTDSEQVVLRAQGDARAFGLRRSRSARCLPAAAAELRAAAGTQFDADVVTALLRVVGADATAPATAQPNT